MVRSWMIYLDYNAASPLLPAARQAMLEALDAFGNPSSAYGLGRQARAVLESARRQIADVVGVAPRSVVFTSGGTESNNTALSGAADLGGGVEVVLPAIEHSSVLEPARELQRRGMRLRWPALDDCGRIDPRQVDAVIGCDTAMVSVGWANNEIGTVQDVDAIAVLCRKKGILFHTDAVQAFGRLGMRLPAADLVSISAHKVGGPRGIGALIHRRGIPVKPLLFGGAQERGLRPGTENVAAAAGFAAALLARASEDRWSTKLRERLWEGLAVIPDVHRYSPFDDCLPNTLLVGFAGLRGESVVAALDLEGVAVSVGSACAAGSGEPSHVLTALGCDDEAARGGVRFSTGRLSTAEEVDAAIAAVHRVVDRMRAVHRVAAGGRS